ncbi:methyltransferase family protein [Neolewinella xylanilytica]|uniref:Methyltransferase family protein n=1 Tax=Neolewinella xylanilytica TaxID=1514080 RepID=A0A2S6I385_9BACT|nr:class I SAM-dependent methyltransferase [Neolewinella xylanilytica]PPK85644.1 methyltransferase family protein [Neolewinella xylanilytica]
MAEHLRYWFFRITSALRWYFRAQTRYDVHSPFLSAFVREVYHDRRSYYAFGLIDRIRSYWSGQEQAVRLLELGAPSKTTTELRRSAASLVRTNAIGDASGRLLFRMCLWLKPQRIVEFGTNAGISTLYLHLADTRTPLQTVEGNPEVAELARTTFSRAGATPSLSLFNERFSDWLEARENGDSKRTLFFLDGDHRREPTIAYVRAMLKRSTTESVFVVADIHWSKEMEAAWEALERLPEVTATLDLYHFGLLFFRSELNGPRLTLIPTRFKPWRIGFF